MHYFPSLPHCISPGSIQRRRATRSIALVVISCLTLNNISQDRSTSSLAYSVPKDNNKQSMASEFVSLGLAAAKHYSRDSKEDDDKWEKMKQEKARDAAENSHKEGWLPGGTAEKGRFVRGKHANRSSEPLESDMEPATETEGCDCDVSSTTGGSVPVDICEERPR